MSEKKRRQLKALEFWQAILEVMFFIVLAAIILILLVWDMDIPEVNAEELPSITFAEMVKADEERQYQKWLLTQKAIVRIDEQNELTPEYLIEVSEEDIDLMARVVMSECSIYLSSPIGTDVAQAIATTIVNRVRDNEFPNTVNEVVNYPNAYSTADNGEPTKKCYSAVYAALTYEAFDKEMFYFREGKYHNFGTPYTQIGNTFFSTR